MAESSKTHHFIPVIIFPSKVSDDLLPLTLMSLPLFCQGGSLLNESFPHPPTRTPSLSNLRYYLSVQSAGMKYNF